MRKFLSVVLLCALSLAHLQAEAARLGGGKSFGRQSGNVTMQRQATPPASPAAPGQAAQQGAQAKPAPAAQAPGAAGAKRPWAGVLGGLAAGLGLAWLANALGLGEAFGNVLLIALLAFVAMAVWRLLAARPRANAARRPGDLAFGGAAGGAASARAPLEYSPKNVGNDASARPWEQPYIGGFESGDAPSGAAGSGSLIGSALSGSQSWGIPVGFDADGFLGAAKRNFVTLQDAWDRSDIATLRSMMTDEMVGEIRTQLAERETHIGSRPNKTDVVMLDAKLLGIEELPDAYMASVEFSGVIREDVSAGPRPFREVWNMTRPVSGASGWLVAGVQALQ